ncbi:MAG: hypothetical protein QOF09_3981 [Alphaproteobacteria bacterium]|nr:hypothetical protein [Alphaproteobacteria bacterium]
MRCLLMMPAAVLQIRAPTLVIAADDDVLAPRVLSEIIAGEIMGSRLFAFTQGGHHFPQTQVNACNELLRGFSATMPKEAIVGDHAKGTAIVLGPEEGESFWQPFPRLAM